MFTLFIDTHFDTEYGLYFIMDIQKSVKSDNLIDKVLTANTYFRIYWKKYYSGYPS